MKNGWIKLYRDILSNPIMKKSEYLSIWIYCLLRANHKENSIIIGGQKTLIKPGQFLTSRARISTDTGIQESKVERILKYLKTEQQIEQQNYHKCRLITIVNWNKYQISEQQNELEVNSKRTASEQQVNTNKNDKNKKNDKKKNICEASKLPHKRRVNQFSEPSKKVIDHLNKVGNRNFRYTNSNLSFIQARMREGFTEKDCCNVVDCKWNDSNFNRKYFRPSTLFIPSKFEGYLQEVKAYQRSIKTWLYKCNDCGAEFKSSRTYAKDYVWCENCEKKHF